MNCYLVGGAVRDQLLGLPVRERDWVVVGASAEDLRARGFKPVHGSFPVFLHPDTGEEYALARRERKTGPGHRGFAVETGPEVTLEEDLLRRDLRVNALAMDEDGHLIDIFHGREDLEQGILRHVSPAFVEDPVRLLRAARFTAQLGAQGFRLAQDTLELLREMAVLPELTSLVPDRLREELTKALSTAQPWRCLETLHQCGALERLLPELAAVLGPVQAHAGPPAALGGLRWLVGRSDVLLLRWVALLAPACASLEQGERVCQALGLERAIRNLLGLLLRWPAARLLGADGEQWLSFLEQARAFQTPRRLEDLILLWAALEPAAGERVGALARRALAAAQRVSGICLGEAGWRGPELGQQLRIQRRAAIARGL